MVFGLFPGIIFWEGFSLEILFSGMLNDASAVKGTTHTRLGTEVTRLVQGDIDRCALCLLQLLRVEVVEVAVL